METTEKVENACLTILAMKGPPPVFGWVVAKRRRNYNSKDEILAYELSILGGEPDEKKVSRYFATVLDGIDEDTIRQLCPFPVERFAYWWNENGRMRYSRG